ncbi:hypothetical protein Tco_0998791 [Tanacetum coccineum]
MMRVTTAFLRGEVAASNQVRKKTLPAWKQQEAGRKQNFDRREDFRNQQRSERRHNKFTLLTKSPKEILALDKGWKDVARNQGAQARQPKGSAKSSKEGINIQRGLASGNLDGSTMAKGYICRWRIGLRNTIRTLLRQTPPGGEATSPLIGFSREIIWPIGQILLPVKIGDAEHSTSMWMNFVIVRSPSLYNGIIGRPGVRKIQAVPSTAHGMLKFLVSGGILTLRCSKIIPLEYMMVSGPEE